MYIVACIRKNGVPQTGLTPVIYGWNVADGSDVLNNVPMVELGVSGIYKYNFTTYKENTNYIFHIDGGSSITDGNERYIVLQKESLLNQI
jgi:hypothetical protein